MAVYRSFTHRPLPHLLIDCSPMAIKHCSRRDAHGLDLQINVGGLEPSTSTLKAGSTTSRNAYNAVPRSSPGIRFLVVAVTKSGVHRNRQLSVTLLNCHDAARLGTFQQTATSLIWGDRHATPRI
jgi:hypothetical protein